MGLRKASAYSRKKVVPYTRVSKKKGKSYVKTVPQQKIVKFSMGSQALYNEGKFPHEISLVSKEKVQIRHNALEACRQYINKKLDEELSGQYLFRIISYPHHIQRENKMLTTPGADRMQTGMQLAFGKSAGKAAIVRDGSRIFFLAVPNERDVKLARDVLKQVKPKIPGKKKIVYEFVKK